MKKPILVGLARTVITPRENLQMSGFARSQVSTGVHDDLHVCGLYLEDAAGRRALLLVFSLIFLSRDLVARIRRALQDETGIPEEAIVFSCTHTHAGPAVQPDGYTVPTPGDYPSYLIRQAVSCGVEAVRRRASARVGFGRTEVFELGRNRRTLLYGGLHPDPEVLIMKVEDARGRLKGVTYNYGCHPSTLDWKNTLISGDWPHYADAAIRSGAGGRIWTAYLQGAQGDINCGYSSELSAVGVDMAMRDYWYIEKKGGQMAEAVLRALPGIKTSGDVDIAIEQGFFDYPQREDFPVTEERAALEAAEAKRRLAELEAGPELRGTRIHDRARREVFTSGQRLAAARNFFASRGGPRTQSMEHQALRVGPAVLATLPGEVFSEIGLRIKRDSPAKTTFLLGLANGYGAFGYIPPAREFVEGDYEVVACVYSPEAEDACVAASLEMIRRVLPAAAKSRTR